MREPLLEPTRGTLDARLFENPRVGIPLTLFFDIVIPLRPFRYEGEIQQTAVRLDFIDFGVSDWRDLAHREFHFPRNPEPGYIDGSLYLAHVHNPADATRIAFRSLKGRLLAASVDIEFDFTYEGPARLGRKQVTWQVEVAIDPPTLDAVIAEARRRLPKNRRVGAAQQPDAPDERRDGKRRAARR